MTLDPKLAQECADWVAEQITEELGGWVSAELMDIMLEHEAALRAEHADPEMDHRTMAERLLPRLAAAGATVHEHGVTAALLIEALHWEDEFLGLAGAPRRVRPS